MGIKTPFSKSELMPQEETLEIRKHRSQLFIGIPKENFKFEKRVCLTPEAVKMFVNAGHRILIESNAGIQANYSDKEYSEAGAEITKDNKNICLIIGIDLSINSQNTRDLRQDNQGEEEFLVLLKSFYL